MVKKPIILFLILTLSLPVGVYDVFALSDFKTPDFVESKYLNLSVSLLHFWPFLVFLKVGVKSKIRVMREPLLWLLATAVIDTIRAIVFGGYVTYELYYCSFIAILFVSLMPIDNTEKNDQDNFLKWFTLVHLIAIAVSVLFSLNKLDFRYNGPNMDVGSTGLIFSLIWLYYVRSKNINWVAISALMIVFLSGSRFAYLGIILSLISYFGKYPLRSLLISLMIVGFLLSIDPLSNRFLSAYQEIMSFRINESSSNSLGGRALSISIGLDLLAESFGTLPFSSVALVENMQNRGFPTYPHSFVVVLAIIAPTIGCVIAFYLFRNLWRIPSVINVYFLIIFLAYGGVIYNFKIIALILYLNKILVINEKKLSTS